MTVRIEPANGNSQEHARIARILLDAADDPNDVQVVTDGEGLAFIVPQELAKKVDLNPVEAEDEKTEAKKSSPQDKKKKKGE